MDGVQRSPTQLSAADPSSPAAPVEPPALPASPVESVDRALLVLEALAGAGARGMGLAELAGGLRLNKSTVHRTLAALRYRGFVTQDASSGTYVLGEAATRLGDGFFGEENLPVLLHPALVALCAATEELVHLGVLSGTHVVYLDKVEPERPVRVWSAVGRRSPALTTALGRALLAYRGTGRSMLSGYARALRDGAMVDLDAVWTILQDARRTGWTTEDEENEPGISCLAVPLLRSGLAVAAVSITAPAERMTAERRAWLHGRIREVLPGLLPHGLSLPPLEAPEPPVA